MTYRRAPAKQVMFKALIGKDMSAHSKWVCEECGHAGKNTPTSRSVVRHSRDTGHSHIRTSQWFAWEMTEISSGLARHQLEEIAVGQKEAPNACSPLSR